MPVTVFLADDHAIVRDGLRSLLQAHGAFTIAGEAGNGRDAVRQVRALHPEVVVMDVAMPDLNGLEATAQILEACPDTRILILSMHGTCQHIARALQSGALGYLLKKSAGEELVQAIRTVHAGRRYLSREVSEALVDDYLSRSPEQASADPLNALSDRERHVLQLVAEGRTTTSIARTLCLAPTTVHTYRGRLMKKLGLHDHTALVKFAIEHGLTPGG